MKKIIFGIVMSLLITGSVYAGKGKKNRKGTKSDTCTPANCDKTNCPPANCVNLSCCK